MYITNDQDKLLSLSEAAPKSVNDAPYANEMAGQFSFYAINVEAALALPLVQSLAGNGGQQGAMALNILSNVSYLSAGANGDGVSRLTLSLKDQDTNALKQLVNIAKEYGGMSAAN
jgi:hypothetical protein